MITTSDFFAFQDDCVNSDEVNVMVTRGTDVYWKPKATSPDQSGPDQLFDYLREVVNDSFCAYSSMNQII